ncbi:MAG TPA: NAD(P)-binding protein [Acidimicrobiales bacterium]|nr:NAD(P)-binding protein [Acidimicrobiales bacterium]
MTVDSQLETDYLVVGAGALGMAFVDSLIQRSDADVVMVERRHRPGGHWLDSYPFVQLHQPSRFYGVDSTPLGQDRIEPDGTDGSFERASGAEICGYFDDIMRHRFLASGRVRFFPMCEYLGDRRFRSRVSGQTTDVTVRRRVVDATYMSSRVPATDPAPFDVAEGVRCVPVGELTTLAAPAGGYVIVGAGKTAMDAICWLLDRGTDPENMTWIRPRDSWILNRAFFQPGQLRTFAGVVLQLEAIVASQSVEEVYERLETNDVVVRTDRSVAPTMMKGGTVSLRELEQLRRMAHVVRLGHVERIELDRIVLEQGTIPTTSDHLHVHCAASGLSDNPPRPIFTDDTITLQLVTRGSLTLSGALQGVLEATGKTTEEKNRLCPPIVMPHTPFDYLHIVLAGISTEMRWAHAPELLDWVDRSRLNLMNGLDDDEDRAAVRELQGRFFAALPLALERMKAFAERVTPRERARIFG